MIPSGGIFFLKGAGRVQTAIAVVVACHCLNLEVTWPSVAHQINVLTNCQAPRLFVFFSAARFPACWPDRCSR